MVDNPFREASNLEKLRNIYINIEKEIQNEDKEKTQIFKSINSISERISKLNNDINELKDERDNVDQLITEISKGYTKIEASTQSLLLLTTRQLKMLKRKYNN
jgi:septal ring factor EnvC (AmiA/AmiB activator)